MVIICMCCLSWHVSSGDSAASASCHGRVPATSTPRSNANSSLGHEDWLASPALFELELPEALSLPGASFLPHDDLDDPSLASADAWLGCDAFLDPMLPDTLDLAEPFLLDSLDPFAGCSPLSDAPMPSSVSSEMSCTFSSSLSLRSRQPALEAPVQPKARVPAYRQKTGRPRRYDTSVAQTQDSEGELSRCCPCSCRCGCNLVGTIDVQKLVLAGIDLCTEPGLCWPSRMEGFRRVC